MTAGDEPLQGAYGLRLRGIRSAALLDGPPPAWPVVDVAWDVGPGAGRPTAVEPDAALINTIVGELTLDRPARTARYATQRALDDEELVHPFLLPAAAVFATWDGNTPLHAGGFAHAGRVWAVAGAKEAGKSTLLARLAGRGLTILADDMLVLTAARTALAGPRAIDLRPESAMRVDDWRGAPAVRAGERHRLPLGPAPPELPLGGVVALTWGEGVEVAPLPPSQRTATLFEFRSLGLRPPAPELLLELAELPGLRLTRPRAWEAEDAAADALLEAVAAATG